MNKIVLKFYGWFFNVAALLPYPFSTALNIKMQHFRLCNLQIYFALARFVPIV